MKQLISDNQLEINESNRNGGIEEVKPKVNRVFIPGIFDMISIGDLKHIEKAKQLFENTEIIIGIFDTKDTDFYEIPIVMTPKQRQGNLEHFRNIDQIISPCQWCITKEFLQKHKIDLVVNYQIPNYKAYHKEIFGYVQKVGKLREIRIDCLSSQEVISRIIRDMDKYIYRNLKRGFERQELNISWFDEKRIKSKYAIYNFFKRLFDPCRRRMKDI